MVSEIEPSTVYESPFDIRLSVKVVSPATIVPWLAFNSTVSAVSNLLYSLFKLLSEVFVNVEEALFQAYPVKVSALSVPEFKNKLYLVPFVKDAFTPEIVIVVLLLMRSMLPCCRITVCGAEDAFVAEIETDVIVVPPR